MIQFRSVAVKGLMSFGGESFESSGKGHWAVTMLGVNRFRRGDRQLPAAVAAATRGSL